MKFPPLSLQTKFLLGLGAIVLTLGIFFAAGMSFHLNSLLRSQVQDKAHLVLGQVDAVQRYVRETLRPKMFETIPDDEFIIEAMSSSFISRQVMDRLKMTEADYLYRRVAVNSRNPDYEVNAMEKGILDLFRANPAMDMWAGYRKVDGNEYFLSARPVRFHAKCMHCHGEPGEAPRELLSRYGSERGFGHTLDGLDGLDMVGVPVEDAVMQIRDATVGYLGVYASGMLIFFALIQVFFNRLVTHNLRRLTAVFRGRFREQGDVVMPRSLEHGDEIEGMVRGMEELGDRLLDAQRQLKDNAANLERTVDLRTRELSKEVAERQADVRLFVRLLGRLNTSQSRRVLWERSLPLVGRRFGADRVGFQCMLTSTRFHSWPDREHKPVLPDDWKEILVSAMPRFVPGRAYIPVGATEAVSDGLLVMEWEDGRTIRLQDQEVLRALGQQLGIAMENLTILDNLLRQKDMLQSIVEGISDPLLLLDGSCKVILANQAARNLTGDLTGRESGDAGSLLPVLFGGDQEMPDCPLKSAMGRGVPHSEEIQAESRFFMVSMYPLAEAGRMVVYIHEITQQKRMMARVRQSEKLATVGQFAAGLAHEMNNPLGVIKCYGELLRNTLSEEQGREDVMVILRHATQAQNVLQDLLTFARPERVSDETCDLRQALAASERVFSVQAAKKGVSVSVDVAPELEPFQVNSQKFEQVMANLFNNAMDAVEPETGSIRIAAVPDREGGVAVSVADNGPGVPEDLMDAVFDPFFTTKEVGKGTGLGLAVVYGLIKDQGGRIEIGYEDGAVFTIHLPSQEQRHS
ncbi:c-type heme family protein [Pseudodesulfovibrio tunisiensis]|uniref:c-type heme family protein n=1 Tax=Pseudodesulfovibrio tunisiensis TaxID=463192 RepID=UPI001FB2743F|nr:DUF3365 domain-containing protein [Pseudodesulfovibrio tunisiensis]